MSAVAADESVVCRLCGRHPTLLRASGPALSSPVPCHESNIYNSGSLAFSRPLPPLFLASSGEILAAPSDW